MDAAALSATMAALTLVPPVDFILALPTPGDPRSVGRSRELLQ